MRLLYALGIRLYGLLLRILAPFHAKAKLWVEGRKGLMQHIKQSVEPNEKHIWFHFASLGEFEQGRSVLEEIKNKFPKEKIVITFFSPSGYEIRKNTNLADYVFYLPEDTAIHAQEFVHIINPKFAVFTKYEYWYHYFEEMGKLSIPIFMISAIFRPDQIFFQTYGGFFRRILSHVTFFFVQNEESVALLKSVGITQSAWAGDTRFDRVAELPKTQRELPEIDAFIAGQKTFVAGSTWPSDEDLLVTWSQEFKDWKLILAPHEIDDAHIAGILNNFPKALRFSAFRTYTAEEIQMAQVLIIDNIGMLSFLYGYGQIAYIGGGFGAGIHNTLEAATYGMPVLFGPKYYKFQEAKELISEGAAYSVNDAEKLIRVFKALCQLDNLAHASAQAKDYVRKHAGATAIIMKYLKNSNLLGDSTLQDDK